jgi:hypothetical protein
VKNKMLPIACLLCYFAFGNTISAQEIKDTFTQKTDSNFHVTDSLPPAKTKTYFQAGASYVTDNIYLGRKDTVALPYFTPSFGYYAKSGFFSSVSFSFLTSAADTRLDMTSLDMGYYFSSGNYDGELSGSKYFYSSQSTSVKSAIKESVAYFNDYDLGFIIPTCLITFNIGDKLDFAASPGVEHSFWLAGDRGKITPTFLVNASTQNYYSDYYKTRRYNPKRKTKPPPKGIQSISGIVLDAGSFKLLDYEFSVPLKYSFGKCSLVFTPVYAIPVNPAGLMITTTLNNGTTSSKTSYEKLHNCFFGTLELNLKF